MYCARFAEHIGTGMNDKLEGKIVFYSPAKEFGFIRPNGSEMGQDIFFHLTQFDHDGDPAVDGRVAFMVEQDPRRPGRQRAKTVVPI
jgi:cold shock CspA family protein